MIFNNIQNYGRREPVVVTITGSINDYAQYNGQTQSVSGYTITIDNPRYSESDIVFSGTATASGTNLGIYRMGLKASQFTNTNAKFDVTFVVNDGYIQIVKRDVTVTVTGNTNTVSYTGSVRSVTGFTLSCSDPLYNTASVGFSGTATASGTEAGTYYMNLPNQLSAFSNSDNNFNVSFNIIDGYIRIGSKPVTVTVIGEQVTATYDAVAHSASYSVVISDPSYTTSDFTFTGVGTVSRTDVGTTNLTLTAEMFTNNNDSFEATFVIQQSGYVTIERKAATVTANNQQKQYGDSDPTLTYEIDGLLGSDTITVRSITRAAGESVNTYRITVTGDKNQGNYTITYEPGTFTITRKAVTVTADNKTKTYGSSDPTLTATVLGTIGSDTVSYELNRVAGNDVGQYTITPTGDAVQGNYTVSFRPGVLIINPKPVTVTIVGNTGSYEYNGSSRTVSGYTVTSISDSGYTTSDFTVSNTSATRTTIGITAMGLTAADKGTKPNYKPTFNITDGWVRITQAQTYSTVAVTVGCNFETGIAISANDGSYSNSAVGRSATFNVPSGKYYTIVATGHVTQYSVYVSNTSASMYVPMAAGG